MSDEALVDLRRRLAAARWPHKELVADRSQGVQVAPLQALTRSFNAADRDGHVAAWEEPQLFADELRAAFRSLREGRSS